MALLRSAATVAGYTMASRVLGFIRDILTAAFLGAGPVADAFFVAQRLPNLFRSLFAEGAFSAAFVPLFAGTIAHDGKSVAKRFAEDSLSVLLAIAREKQIKKWRRAWKLRLIAESNPDW